MKLLVTLKTRVGINERLDSVSFPHTVWMPLVSIGRSLI